MQNDSASIVMKKRMIQIIIFFILLVFCALSYPQSVNTKNLLDIYKDIYLWQEPRNNIPVSDSLLTVLGRWAWGPCLAVDTDSNFAFIGNGPTFHVLDISITTNPEIIGEYLTEGLIYDIEVKDNVAFVCIGRGLYILDIADPSAPEEFSFIGISGGAISFALDSSFAYVTTFGGAMWVVDISDLQNPFLRGSIYAGGERAASVEARDGYVYIGNPEWPYLEIVDATNPDTLTATYFEIGGFGSSSFIKDTLLFVGVRYLTSHLKIYSISNLAEPEFVGQIEMGDSIFIGGITVSEDGFIAYALFGSATPGTEGIYSIDISDLGHPLILDNFERATQLGGSGISLFQNTLVAGCFSGLCVLDISNQDNLQFQSFFPTGGFAWKIQLKDSLAFVASGLAGLWILDVTNPAQPIAISNVNTNGITTDLVVEDTLVYIVNWAVYLKGDTSRGLWIIDVSDLYQPKILSHYVGIVRFSNSFIHPNSIFKQDSLILISQSGGFSNDSTLEIINVTDPLFPERVSVFRTSFSPYDVCSFDTIVYLATADGGLRIINISEPDNPVEISNILNNSFAVAFDKQYVYTFSADFFIINVDDPTNPYIVSSLQNHTSSGDIDLFISDNYAYWADWSLGVIDISDPENPIQVTTFDGKDRGLGVAAAGDKIFFADQTQGVWILKNNLVTNIKDDTPFIHNYKLYQNYPNPFNPVTIIEFEIPQKEKVLIEVFDLLGQRIKILLNEEMEKGKHSINFNAFGLSSGIYFYRIRTKETTVTKKMVLLR